MKTKENNQSVAAFLDSIENDTKRTDSYILLKNSTPLIKEEGALTFIHFLFYSFTH